MLSIFFHLVISLLFLGNVIHDSLGLLVICLGSQLGLMMRAGVLLGQFSERHGSVRARAQGQAQLQGGKLSVGLVKFRCRHAEQLVLVGLGKGDVWIVVSEVLPREVPWHVDDLAVRSFQGVLPSYAAMLA